MYSIIIAVAIGTSPALAFSPPKPHTNAHQLTNDLPKLHVATLDPTTTSPSSLIDLTGIAFSGLKGKPLSLTTSDFPDRNTVAKVIPEDCYQTDTARSLFHLSVSVVGTALCTALGVAALPYLDPAQLWTLPFWIAYDIVTGTVAMGLWVLAHECGHGAFSSNKALQDGVGYVLHSIMLTPYYSWQRSHAVHHRYTNHMELGETRKLYILLGGPFDSLGNNSHSLVTQMYPKITTTHPPTNSTIPYNYANNYYNNSDNETASNCGEPSKPSST
jgi:hypothetical protein